MSNNQFDINQSFVGDGGSSFEKLVNKRKEEPVKLRIDESISEAVPKDIYAKRTGEMRATGSFNINQSFDGVKIDQSAVYPGLRIDESMCGQSPLVNKPQVHTPKAPKANRPRQTQGVRASRRYQRRTNTTTGGVPLTKLQCYVIGLVIGLIVCLVIELAGGTSNSKKISQIEKSAVQQHCLHNAAPCVAELPPDMFEYRVVFKKKFI